MSHVGGSSPFKVIKHPVTGVLMAPGSKVWPYFVDHATYGRFWIGPQSEYNVHVNQLNNSSSLPTDPVNVDQVTTPQVVSSVAPSSSSSAITKQTKPIVAKQRQTKESDMAPPRNLAKLSISDTEVDFKTARQVEIDKWYNELMERKDKLRQSGETSESSLIQAAVNAGVMLGWNKRDVLSVVHRWMARSGDNENQAAEVKKGRISPEMIEVAAEFQRVEFKGEWKELDGLLQLYKGKSSGKGNRPTNRYAVENRKAPGMLMFIQAALSVAFWKCLESAVEENEELDQDSFEFKASHYFRVPTTACGKERVYLSQMSRLGTKGKDVKKFSACPGIERPLVRQEKAAILEASKSHVPQSPYIIEMLTRIFEKSEQVHDDGHAVRQGSVTRAAMERMSDEGYLILDYIYRQGVGFPILVGDEIVEGEEEEEEDSENDSGDDEDSEEDAATTSDSSTGTDAFQVDTQRRSLILRLQFGHQALAIVGAILSRQPAPA